MDRGGHILIVAVILLAAVAVVAVGLLMLNGTQVHISGSGSIDINAPPVTEGVSSIKVTVVGVPSQGVLEALASNESVTKGIEYPANFPPNSYTLDMLKEYQVVIAQGDPKFDMNTREALRGYVNGGGKLIVVGDAGSKHPEYQNVAGWSWPAGQGIPVPAQIVGEFSGYTDVANGSQIRWSETSHPIARGMKIVGISLPANSTVVKTTPNGDVVAFIDTDEGTVPAIIEGGSGLGKVVYFAYDPGLTPEIFINTIAYLTT